MIIDQEQQKPAATTTNTVNQLRLRPKSSPAQRDIKTNNQHTHSQRLSID